MASFPMHALALTGHCENRSAAVRSVAAQVSRQPGVLAVTYILAGDLDRLQLPAPRPPRIVNRLWQHTCFELFITRIGLPGYHEFNFSPSAEWAAYEFAGYRGGAAFAHEELDPRIAVRRAAGELELDAVIRLDCLSPMHPGARLSLAVSAVVEDRDGVLSYWALRHPPGEPDFHHPGAFTLQLDEARH